MGGVDETMAFVGIYDQLGGHVPVAQLTAWVRAARAKGEARLEFRDDGLPALIEQDGWKIEYPDYDTARKGVTLVLAVMCWFLFIVGHVLK